MPIYEYRCDTDGLFDTQLPMGTAPASLPCPVCRRQAPRAMSAPLFRSASRLAWTAARDRADKSRYEPEVVHSLPPSAAPARTVALTPQLRGLPRP